jgi:hypothetical protein
LADYIQDYRNERDPDGDSLGGSAQCDDYKAETSGHDCGFGKDSERFHRFLLRGASVGTAPIATEAATIVRLVETVTVEPAGM